MTGSLRENLWEVLREYDVDGCLFLAVTTLYFCSEICIRVGGVKAQPSSAQQKLNYLRSHVALFDDHRALALQRGLTSPAGRKPSLHCKVQTLPTR